MTTNKKNAFSFSVKENLVTVTMQRNLLEREKPKRIKVITLGGSGVGKSTLLQNYTRKRFRDLADYCFHDDYALVEENIDGFYVQFQLWDRVGKHKRQALSPSIYPGTDCCILVYSVTSRSSFEKVKMWRKCVQNVTNPVSFILLGNKIDLRHRREVTTAEAKKWAESQNIVFMEVSANDNIHVKAVFLEVGRIAIYDKPKPRFVRAKKIRRVL